MPHTHSISFSVQINNMPCALSACSFSSPFFLSCLFTSYLWSMPLILSLSTISLLYVPPLSPSTLFLALSMFVFISLSLLLSLSSVCPLSITVPLIHSLSSISMSFFVFGAVSFSLLIPLHSFLRFSLQNFLQPFANPEIIESYKVAAQHAVYNKVSGISNL